MLLLNSCFPKYLTIPFCGDESTIDRLKMRNMVLVLTSRPIMSHLLDCVCSDANGNYIRFRSVVLLPMKDKLIYKLKLSPGQTENLI